MLPATTTMQTTGAGRSGPFRKPTVFTIDASTDRPECSMLVGTVYAAGHHRHSPPPIKGDLFVLDLC
jgi:hypothetical protein